MRLTTGSLTVPGTVVWIVSTRASDPANASACRSPASSRTLAQLLDDLLTLKALPTRRGSRG